MRQPPILLCRRIKNLFQQAVIIWNPSFSDAMLKRVSDAEIGESNGGRLMRGGIAALAVLAAIMAAPAAMADQVEVHGARIWNAPEHTRIVIDTASPVRHKIFSLDGPERLVVDLTDARMSGGLPKARAGDLLVSGLRSGVRNNDDLRIVMDLKQPVKAKSFLLAPNEQYGHRLVIDLEPKSGPGPVSIAAGGAAPPARHLSVQPKGTRSREIIIAIDAGHGGEDPGAIGSGGTHEKDITLAIARRLAKRVDASPGMKALLIRDADYYIALRQRINKAHRHNADLFISIHADAFKDPRVRGSSVFTLSRGGATSEAAKWLADRENKADLIGGVQVDDQHPELAPVLIDMIQNATIEHSGIVATRLLGELSGLGHVHQPHVQKAGFAVLKSRSMPSVLVETAFISNPEEEKRLRSARHQNQIADSLLAGIIAYFREYPPPGTYFARRPGETRDAARDASTGPAHGDTLSQIADSYALRLAALRNVYATSRDSAWPAYARYVPES